MFSTSFVSKTRTSHDLRQGFKLVALADPRTDSIDQTPRPMPRSTDSIADITIPHARPLLQRGLVLAPYLLRARLDERVDRDDGQRQHVELAQHRYPGGEVDRADDEGERSPQDCLGRGRNPL